MTTTNDQSTATKPLDRKSEAAFFTSEFGEELGRKYFCDGLDIDEARVMFTKDQMAAKDATIAAHEKTILARDEEIKALKADLENARQVARSTGGDERTPADSTTTQASATNGSRSRHVYNTGVR